MAEQEFSSGFSDLRPKLYPTVCLSALFGTLGRAGVWPEEVG